MPRRIQTSGSTTCDALKYWPVRKAHCTVQVQWVGLYAWSQSRQGLISWKWKLERGLVNPLAQALDKAVML